MRMKNKIIFLFLILIIPLICASAVTDSIHLNVQAVDGSGNVVTGTYKFEFNISTSGDCANVVFTNYSTLTTNSQGIISYYLDNTNLNYSDQYWLCIYRNGVVQSTEKVGQTPYAFAARNVTLSGVEPNSNFALGNYNLTTTGSGFFNFLGSLASRITSFFVQNIDFNGMINGSGNINTTANITANTFFGNWNGSSLYALNTTAGIQSLVNSSYVFQGSNKNQTTLSCSNITGASSDLCAIITGNASGGSMSYTNIAMYNQSNNFAGWQNISGTLNATSILMGSYNLSNWATNVTTNWTTLANIQNLLAGTNISQYAFNQTSVVFTTYNSSWDNRGLLAMLASNVSAINTTNNIGLLYNSTSSMIANLSINQLNWTFSQIANTTFTQNFTLLAIQNKINNSDMAFTRLNATNFIDTGNLTDILGAGENFTAGDLFANTTGIGIGTTNPTYLLTVGNSATAVNLSGLLYVNSTSGNIGINVSNPAMAFQIGSPNANSLIPFSVNITSLQVGINAAFSDIQGQNAELYLGPSDTLRGLRIAGPSGDTVPALSIGGYGNVSIDSPGKTSGRFVLTNAGNIGIGSTSPQSLLEIKNSAGKNELNSSGVLYVNSTVGAVTINTPSDMNLQKGLVVNGNISFSSPLLAEITGTLDYFSIGNGYYVISIQSSNPMYKNNITNISQDNINDIMKLRPVTYGRNGEQNYTETGFLSTEMEKINPAWVVYDVDGRTITYPNGTTAKNLTIIPLSVNYQDIAVTTTALVQEQQKIIISQNKTINELNLKINAICKNNNLKC
jgi:hypothetical protein